MVKYKIDYVDKRDKEVFTESFTRDGNIYPNLDFLRKHFKQHPDHTTCKGKTIWQKEPTSGLWRDITERVMDK
jgi:hypothetical protein